MKALTYEHVERLNDLIQQIGHVNECLANKGFVIHSEDGTDVDIFLAGVVLDYLQDTIPEWTPLDQRAWKGRNVLLKKGPRRMYLKAALAELIKASR